MCRLSAARLSIPKSEDRGLSPRFGKLLSVQLASRPDAFIGFIFVPGACVLLLLLGLPPPSVFGYFVFQERLWFIIASVATYSRLGDDFLSQRKRQRDTTCELFAALPRASLIKANQDMKQEIYTVYALIDPRDHSVRSIGITDDIYGRMKAHLRETANMSKYAWIQELQKEQRVFIMHTLEQCKQHTQAVERETYWIQHYLKRGAPLLNRDIGTGIMPSLFQPKEHVIAALLAQKPEATAEEIAHEAGCSVRTADKWMKRCLQVPPQVETAERRG